MGDGCVRHRRPPSGQLRSGSGQSDARIDVDVAPGPQFQYLGDQTGVASVSEHAREHAYDSPADLLRR